MEKRETRVVIIGAGITGLSIAYYLNKKNIDFTIIDRLPKAGGVISTHKENGFVYETGPNTGVLSQPQTAELIKELGGHCELEIANAEAKKRLIWKGDSWQPLPAGLKSAIVTPLFTLKDKFRILGEPFRSKGKDPDETLDKLVKRRMGQSFLDYAVDPFILGIYSGDPSYLVTRYALPKLYNLEQNYGSFIGGAIKKSFQKKDERSKLATGDVFSIKGGLSNLIDALVEKIGKQSLLLEFKNTTVTPEKSGLRKYNSNDKHNFTVKGSSKGTDYSIVTEYVISTTGSHELPEILPFLTKQELSDLNNLIYAKVIQATIGYNKWEGIDINAFGGLIPFKEDRDALGILFISSFLSGRAPAGGALLSVFMGGFRKPHLVDLSDDEVITILAKEFMAMTGLSSFNPDLLKLTRYSHAIPQYGLSTGVRLEAIETVQKKYPGLIIAGNLRNGIGMSDRIKQGREIAESLN